MATFDADAWLAAHEPWSLRLGGRVYRSRPVSILAVIAYQAAVAEAQGDPLANIRALERILRLAFPWRWTYLRRDPVALILGLDDAARATVVRDFFDAAATRFRPLIPTTGTDSPLPTPRPTTDAPPAEAISA